MVPLTGEGQGLWTLIFGKLRSRDTATGRRNLSVAVTGHFDGRRFSPLAEREVDFGSDCYAFQAYPGEEGPIGIGWAANWTNVVRNRDFPSCMTVPRRLVWRDGTLLTAPVDAVASMRQAVLSNAVSRALQPVPLPEGGADYELTLAEPGAPFAIRLHHDERDLAVIGDGDGLEIVDRPLGDESRIRYRATGARPTTLRVVFDTGILEVFADDGRWCGTRRLPPGTRVTALSVSGERIAGETLWTLRR